MIEIITNSVVTVIIGILVIGIIIGIFIGQAIVLHMNKGEFEKLKNENEKMHYVIAEYKAKEAYEFRQAMVQGQGSNRPKGGES